jgi:putative FmdB family regulatory protein
MLYEFECKNCGKRFEEIRKLNQNSDKATCPDCKGESKKVMSTFGFKIIGFASINGYSHANK